MSAAVLRQTAETLRERAKAATPGPWNRATTGVESGDHWYVLDLATMHAVCWIRADDGDNEDQRPRDAAYIANMHPGVGSALAKLFDTIATALEAGGNADAQVAVDTLTLAHAISGGDVRV